jgi:predicted DCC family thiol-disulfide oxidoreductase YuxK
MKEGLPPLVGPNDRVVLFDGVCKLCGAWARFLIRVDRQNAFKLASIQSPEGKALLEWFDLPTDSFETMVVVEGNRVFLQSAAFIQVMAHLPLPWKFAAVIWLVPAFIRNWLYHRMAVNRYKLFGQHDSCLLPTPDHQRRFLGS